MIGPASRQTLRWLTSSAPRAMAAALRYRIPPRAAELDAVYRRHVENFEDHLDPIECNILRIATYELQHHPEIPYKVVINEAVNLAHSYGADDSHKFVNGVLDPLCAELRGAEVAR